MAVQQRALVLLLLIILVAIVAQWLRNEANSSPEVAVVPPSSAPTLPPQPSSTPTVVTPTATATPRPTPTASATPDLARVRPYTDASIWNSSIGPNPRYDPNSDQLIEHLGTSPNGGVLTSDTTQYTYPVYYADESTPRWDVPCVQWSCTVVSESGTTRERTLEDVPIPDGARPSPGSDAQMIIIDRSTGTEYDLWQAERTDEGWQVSNGAVYNVFWDGTPEEYGSRGAGVPYLAGLIRAWEIDQERIEHVIAFAYPYPAKDRCVFPASKTDGQSTDRYAIPEGARLQLDPSLTEEDFDRMGLGETGQVIARALQEYGMILIDVSGRPKIYAEDLASNPYADAAWDDTELKLAADTISAIPYTDFRVLALPDAYWAADRDAPKHGACYRD